MAVFILFPAAAGAGVIAAYFGLAADHSGAVGSACPAHRRIAAPADAAGR